MVTRHGTGSPYQGHRRVLIDTNVWLYHLEGNHTYGLAAAELLTAVEEGVIEGIVSYWRQGSVTAPRWRSLMTGNGNA